MARPKPARRNEGLERLERKLAVYAHGYPPTSRTAALAILTGNGPAVGSNQPHAGATYRATLQLLSPQGAAPVPRFHIERTRPPRRVEHVWRVVIMIAIAVAAGLAVTLLTRASDPVQVSAPVDMHTDNEAGAALTTADSDPIATQPVVVAGSSSPEQGRTEPSPSVPVPATQMGVLLDEHFASNARGWANDSSQTAWLATGTYWLAPRQASHFVAVSIPGARDLGDVVVSAWFHKAGGPQGGGYGLILRDQATDPLDGQTQLGRYYVFEAGDRGQFGVWLRDGDHWVDLLTWTGSDAVNRGTAANELTVTAIGDQLSFLINGTPVATQTDTLLHTGAGGVFAGGDDNQVALDRLTVRVPR